MIIYVIVLSAIIFLALIYLFVFLFPGFKGKRPLDKKYYCDYAHRGLHSDGIPENSLAAFTKATQVGYGIELDAQLSKDDKVVVFHDYILKRMTGDERKLKDLTGEELKALALSGTDEKIPYLSEVLDAVAGKVPLLIELKGEDTNTALCPKVKELLDAYTGPYIIESFNPMLLHWFKKNDPKVRRGFLTTKVCKSKGLSVLNVLLDSLMLNVLCRPDFVAYDISYKKLSVNICTKFFSLPAFAWTVRKEEDYEKLPECVPAIFEGFIPDNKKSDE